ncbi:MAG: hypothetical protein CMI55_00830 [Parcubacteria group bacterium]|jgi:hypothetical protein|nr:hypothetical protein [Parcubacteria group bacterium]|tara:strand:- start:21246 stop:21845 length:600 start_codon:yes stop_codon:yes gene_type:complete
MRLSFLSSKTREIQRLLNIHSEYQWFLDNDFPIVLPKFYKKLYQESKNKNEFKTELEKEFNKIYKEEDYKEKVKTAKSNWEKIEDKFFSILKKHNQKIKDKYLCYVSLYGPEGQFKYPNIIDLRISNELDIKQANETIAHELIHLIVLRKTEKLNLNYKQTEGVVDSFFKETDLKDLFPDYKLQSMAEHDNKISEKIYN